jgi:hypothetical protein
LLSAEVRDGELDSIEKSEGCNSDAAVNGIKGELGLLKPGKYGESFRLVQLNRSAVYWSQP